MSREFSTSEIIRQKCSICGSKNKIYTELVYDGEYCGYKLTCCNCGHVDTFIDDIDHIATHVYGKGREVCIHLTTCKNKKCPYYGKYPLWTAATTIESILAGLACGCGPDCPSDCDCPCGYHDGQNNSNNNQNNNIENLDTFKLDINDYEINQPRFH